LAYWDYQVSEARLGTILGATAIGTFAPNIRRLDQLGFSVTYLSGILSEVYSYLNEGIPVLAFLRTGNLPYWQEDLAHALVIVGMDENAIFVNDPAFKVAPQRIPVDYFMLAWSDFDYYYAVIRPK
jgi:hypothetical protein